MRKPDNSKSVHGGIQKLYKFLNGYGASVVRHSSSYGNESGKWELAVIKDIEGDFEKFNLCYDTPITGDVKGYLTEEMVDDLLKRIEAL